MKERKKKVKSNDIKDSLKMVNGQQKSAKVDDRSGIQIYRLRFPATKWHERFDSESGVSALIDHLSCIHVPFQVCNIFALFAFCHLLQVFHAFNIFFIFPCAMRFHVAALASGFSVPTSLSAIWLVLKIKMILLLPVFLFQKSCCKFETCGTVICWLKVSWVLCHLLHRRAVAHKLFFVIVHL